jgi:pimeloyl-ACP methyl ester carboxylesterase
MPGPVIVVPGFMGTALGFTKGVHIDSTVWVSALNLGLDGPDDLQLDTDGVSPGPLADGPLGIEGAASGSSVVSMVQALSLLGYSPYIFFWDWRLNLFDTADKLAKFIPQVTKGQDFRVVAHSAGGILARLAYAEYGDGKAAPDWKKTVFIGTPHGGTYTAAASLGGYWNQFGWFFTLATLCGLLPRATLPNLILQGSPIDRLLNVVASWPSIYQLMPTNEPPWQGSDPNVKYLYRLSTWVAQNKHVQQKWIDSAEALQAQLEQLQAQPHAPGVDVIGTGTPTLSAITDSNDLGSEDGYDRSLDGDGVVTISRAFLAGNGRVYINGVHAQLPADSAVQSILPRLLGDETFGVSTITKNDFLVPNPVKEPSYIQSTVPILAQRSQFLNLRGDP